MRSLVTGGAGLIGSHLVEALLERGQDVVAIDNLSTGQRRNISHLEDHPRFELVVDDILTSSDLDSHVEAADHVYHLAAAVGVELIMQKPVETLLTNVRGTERILDLAARYGTKTFFASTSEVYGKTMEQNGNIKALRETHDRTLGPTSRKRWAYACSKAFDEFLALAYVEERDLPVVIARFFNTVGPRQTGQYGMVVPRFCEQALKGEPIRIFGDGQQSRSFLHVKDAVAAVVELMALPKAEGDIFNVGHGDSISIEELAKLVVEETGSNSELTYIPYEEAYGEGYEDMRTRTPNIERVKAAIGFEPKHDIRDIVQSVIEYMSDPAITGAER